MAEKLPALLGFWVSAGAAGAELDDVLDPDDFEAVDFDDELDDELLEDELDELLELVELLLGGVEVVGGLEVVVGLGATQAVLAILSMVLAPPLIRACATHVRLEPLFNLPTQ